MQPPRRGERLDIYAKQPKNLQTESLKKLHFVGQLDRCRMLGHIICNTPRYLFAAEVGTNPKTVRRTAIKIIHYLYANSATS